MTIFRAEWRRFFARRFTRIMLLVVIVLMGVIAVGLAIDSTKPTAAVRARAQAQIDQILAEQKVQSQQCVAVQNGAPDPTGEFQLPPGATCADMFGGPADFELNDFMPNEFVLSGQAHDVMVIYAALVALFGFAVGASYVGAEWSSGGMMNLLLWKPRRMAVLGGKLVTLLTAVTVSAVAFAALWLGMLSAVAAGRGAFGHATSGDLQSLGLAGGRALVLGLVAAVAGFALASIGRNTVTALAAAIGYVLLFEGAGHIIFGRLFGSHRPQRYYLSSYVIAWLNKKQTYDYEVCTPTGDCSDKRWSISMGHASVVVGVLLVIIVAWAFAAFKRRDVT